MLQQTRVETVIPYFERWMETFPTISSLARATEQQVLSAWEGLGYYRRARNLHRAAAIITKEFGGEIPGDPRLLRALPGIGRYTAGAVASIAFGLDEPVLDGNIKRVLARLFDIDLPVNSTNGERHLWQVAAESLPSGQAGTYNQALMDLGATVCLPKNPRCALCPVKEMCICYSKGTQASRPVMKPRKALPHHIETVGVILKSGRVMLIQRPSKGLLGGMWAFPGGRVEEDPLAELQSVLESEYRLVVVVTDPLPSIQHAYTHFRVTVYPFLCEFVSLEGHQEFNWVKVEQMDEYPMGKVDRTIARNLAQRVM